MGRHLPASGGETPPLAGGLLAPVSSASVMGNNAPRHCRRRTGQKGVDLLEQATRRAVPDEFVESFARGALVTGEFHCSECGYEITVHSQLPRSPMCGGEAWEQAPWSPFTRQRESL